MGDKEDTRELLEKRIRVETLSGYVLTGVLIVITIMVTLYYFYTEHEMDDMKEYYSNALDSVKLYCDIPDHINFGVNGIYYSEDQYYCVNTKDKDIDEIMMTDYHEMCHHLIYQGNSSHFCEDFCNE